jgi:hypothetical protein
MVRHSGIVVGGVFALLLLSCGQSRSPTAETRAAEAPAMTAAAVKAADWPSSLNVMGDGFPRPGDPCRRLGESPATANYLDDSARLVGCPGAATVAATAAIIANQGGKVVGSAGAGDSLVTLISIPTGDSNAGMMPASTTANGDQPKGSSTR